MKYINNIAILNRELARHGLIPPTSIPIEAEYWGLTAYIVSFYNGGEGIFDTCLIHPYTGEIFNVRSQDFEFYNIVYEKDKCINYQTQNLDV